MTIWLACFPAAICKLPFRDQFGLTFPDHIEPCDRGASAYGAGAAAEAWSHYQLARKLSRDLAEPEADLCDDGDLKPTRGASLR